MRKALSLYGSDRTASWDFDRPPPAPDAPNTRRSSYYRSNVIIIDMRWSEQGPGQRRGYHHGNLREALIEAALDQRSEEHTSELQSQSNLVCRLLLEKKKKKAKKKQQDKVK